MKKFEKWSLVLIVAVFLSVEIFECRFLILQKFSSNCVKLGDYQLSFDSDYYIEKSQRGFNIIDTKSTDLAALISVIHQGTEFTVAKISLKIGNLKERKFASDIRIFEGIANNAKEREKLYENTPFIVEVIGVGDSESCILVQYWGEVSRKDRFLSEILRDLENSRKEPPNTHSP